MKLHATLSTTVALTFASFLANAENLTYDFATDAQGFQNVTWQAGTPAGWGGLPGTVQQAHTAGGWQMSLTKEFIWGAGGGSPNQQLAMRDLANQGADAHLAFDVMADLASFPPTDSTWFQFNIVGNSDGSATWTQSQIIDGYQNAGQADLRTWHFDLPFSAVGWQPGDSWFQFWTGANSAANVPVNLYLDNIRAYAVPEPGTLATASLAAVAMVGLLLRRRR